MRKKFHKNGKPNYSSIREKEISSVENYYWKKLITTATAYTDIILMLNSDYEKREIYAKIT